MRKKWVSKNVNLEEGSGSINFNLFSGHRIAMGKTAATNFPVIYNWLELVQGRQIIPRMRCRVDHACANTDGEDWPVRAHRAKFNWTETIKIEIAYEGLATECRGDFSDVRLEASKGMWPLRTPGKTRLMGEIDSHGRPQLSGFKARRRR